MDVDKHIEKAEDAVKRRNFEFAINLYQQLLLINPNHMRARKGLYDAALRNWERKHPGRGGKTSRGSGLGATLAILLRAGGRKDPTAVMAACDKALARSPREPKVLEKLGYAAARAGHLESAVFAFEKLLELAPSNLEAAKNLGRLHQRLGNIRTALESYDQALRIKPGDQESIKARKDLSAEAVIQGHGYAEARSSRDLMRDKDQRGEPELLDRVVRDEAEIVQAIALVEDRLRNEPEDGKLLTKLGELLEQKGDLRRAEEVFARLSMLEPTRFDHREHVGDLKIRMAEHELEALENSGAEAGMIEAARQALAALRVAEFGLRVEAHPTDMPQRFRYGEALYQVGRLDEAIGEFQKTVKDPRKRLDSQVMMANAFMKKGMLDLAASQLHRALEGAGEGTRRAMQIRYNLGLILEKQGRRAEARAEYLHVYERDINFRDIKTRLEALDAAPDAPPVGEK
ncbi:MAG: tetratricopeptide repeat protein [Planctomycetes bacterium]|nr:tetratricopeptide repeat protein [Planctomycetota bacterium]